MPPLASGPVYWPSTRRSNAEVLGRPRPPLARLLHARGLVPGFGVAHSDVTLITRDGVRLEGTYLPARARRAGDSPAVLLAHGFGGHRRKPAYAYLAEQLSETTSVLTLDLRGHGRSGGRSTLGLAETLDVAAGAAWLRRHGHDWLAVVGVSMGATAALRSAGTAPTGAYDAVCTISAVSRWGLADTAAMQHLTKAVTFPAYRSAYRAVLGVRIAAGAWPDGSSADDRASWPVQPVDAVAGIAPTPLLLVHGVDDHYFGPEQAHALHAAAADPVTLWLEPAGFGHAEDGFSPGFAQRLRDAIELVHARGRWPERQARSGPLRSRSSRS